MYNVVDDCSLEGGLRVGLEHGCLQGANSTALSGATLKHRASWSISARYA